MLTRIWHGRTSPENAEAYERLLRTEVLPGIAARRIDGYQGAFLLRRELGDGPAAGAVGDVWICPARDVRGTPRAPEAEPEYGMTVRVYDASLEGWRVVWSGPRYGVQQTFMARARGGDIVQEGTRTDGTQLQWIFSNIIDRAFDWRSEVQEGGEWRIRERIAARRR